jgi:hypothetical protein
LLAGFLQAGLGGNGQGRAFVIVMNVGHDAELGAGSPVNKQRAPAAR